jgi:hypothetical protein
MVAANTALPHVRAAISTQSYSNFGLEGAADGLHRRAGLRAWPMLRPTQTELTAKLRQALGADRLDQVFSVGSRLSQQQPQSRTGEPPAPRHPRGPARETSAVVLTATASRSPHTRGTSSGCRRLGLPACRNSSTAQGRPFCWLPLICLRPRCARMTGICGPVAPRVQIRRLGDAIGGMLPARRGPKRPRRHCSCVCLAEARPAAVDTSPAHRRIGLRRSERRMGKPASLTRRDLSIYRRPG